MLRKNIVCLLLLFSCICEGAAGYGWKEVFSLLDLDRPGLEKVKEEYLVAP